MKNLFTGWKQVFKFTANQTTKGKGFKLSTFGIFILIFVAFCIINCAMAGSQLDEEEEGVINLEDSAITKVHFVCDDVSNPEFVNTVVDFTKQNVKKITIENAAEGIAESKLSEAKGEIVMEAFEEEGVLKFNFYTSEKSEVPKSDVTEFASQFIAIVNNSKYMVSGLDEVSLGMITMSKNGATQTVSVDEIEEEFNMEVMVTEMVVPMIYSFVFYFMILTYGQSVSKQIMAEKTSKLMEMLLTSVKPYAIITGKVLSISLICIGQAVFWIVGGVLGFMVGDVIALKINPDYTNMITEVIDIIKLDSSGAFTALSIVMGIICMVLGFFVYCILAAFSSAIVNRIEDMANAQLVFQLPIVIGFVMSYIGPLFADNKLLLAVIRFLPISSPFSLPAEVVIGKAEIWEGFLSMGILGITCFILIVWTGKVYKNKVFNR